MSYSSRNQLQVFDEKEQPVNKDLLTPEQKEALEASSQNASVSEQKELQKAIPEVMEHALESVKDILPEKKGSEAFAYEVPEDEKPKKKLKKKEKEKEKENPSQNYQPIPIATIEPTVSRSGRIVKPKKFFDE